MIETMAELVAHRADDDGLGLVTATGRWTHREVVACSSTRAAWLLDHHRASPFHVAVLLDNIAEYVWWLQAAALAGAVVVGANATHRGEELARDVSHTECQLLVTDREHRRLVEELDLGAGIGVANATNPRVVVVDDPAYESALAPYAGAAVPEVAVNPDDLGYLLFTSGTSGAPKACRCTQGRLARIAGIVAQMYELERDDVCYVSMPLFHSNALMTGWGPALAAGSALALPSTGRFSASGFLPDVRRFGATYFNYVGKPLAYILATEVQADDGDNPLRRAFGNEAAPADVEAFSSRFDCRVTDGYGSTEGGAVVSRTPDTPTGALGIGPPGTIVVDPDTLEECPRAHFDSSGRLVNADQCIGELVSTTGAAGFEGYWHNQEAESARTKNGWYWTGDLAYRDDAGFIYFAGRDFDWLRVDGENFAAAPIERIVARYPSIVLAAVYAVPDLVVGDQVMVALERHREAGEFDPSDFAAFLARQDDLGPKWIPRFVRLVDSLPVTATTKVLKKTLRAQRWNCTDPVFRFDADTKTYVRLTPAQTAVLEEALATRTP